MNRLGNVLIHGSDPARNKRLEAPLANANCNVTVCTRVDDLWAQARDGRPDLVLVDVGSLGPEGVETTAALPARKLDNVPVVLWASKAFRGLYDDALTAGAADVFVGDLDDTGADELMLRLRPLIRLSTQLAEVRRRTALARDFGVPIAVDPDLSVGDGPYRVLAIGESPSLARRVANALGKRARDVIFQENPNEARDRLFAGEFDAAVMAVNAGNPTEDLLAFCHEVRNHPRLFNLPLVVLGGPGVALPHDQTIREGASVVLDEVVDDDRLRYFVAAYGRRQQLRRKVRDAIEATKTVRTRGTHTYSYMPGFLRAHLTALIEESRDWQKHLTVLIFTVTEKLKAFQDEFGEEAARELTRQIAQWISGLVRLEDVVANFGGGEFCVTLPDTPLEEAETVMDRITGILEYTDFAVKDVYRPVKVIVRVGYAELEPDDNAAKLIARARARLG